MIFNSYIFVFVFFPLCMLGYFGINACKKYTAAQIFLLLMSLWFYAHFNLNYLLIIVLSIIVNYLFVYLMQKQTNYIIKKIECIVAVIFNVGVLIYYKYFDFIIININMLLNTDYLLTNILLPLGISFFTFQQISYIVDAYRDETKKYGFVQYACFVTYFPQLIAGPIVTHDELIPQFEDVSKKNFRWDSFSCGLFMLALGLAKKVLIADAFAGVVDWGYSCIGELSTTNALIVILSYTIQIYFDFSGYCDMAIGIGKMMNIDLPINFDSPYKSYTIIEFWNRWHKTLTRFFTKYIYIPLGGSRGGMLKTCRNILVVFFVSGLWHGASWNFVLWGILHGIFMVITRCCKKQIEKIPDVLNWIITFSFVNVAWIFFRASSIKEGFLMIRRVLNMEFGTIEPQIVDAIGLSDIGKIFEMIFKINIVESYPLASVLIVMVVVLGSVLSGKNAKEYMVDFKPTVRHLVITVGLFIICVMSFADMSPFLYFNF